MEKEPLKRIFDFLEEKEQQNPPFLWKWKNEIPFTEEDLDVNGDLDLTYSNIESLPEGLKVDGHLILTYCENISSLPEGLIVRGNLILDECINLFSLPKGLEVGGNLDLSHSKIESLPKGLKVGGYLNLRFCRKLTLLPEGLKVGGSLDLESSKIKSLPKGLEVGNNLYVGNTKLALYLEKYLREMIEPGFIKGEVVDL